MKNVFRVFVVATFLLISQLANAQVVRTWEERSNLESAPTTLRAQLPNGPQGEEFASQVWITRTGIEFTTSYLFKDHNQFNPIYLDSLAFYGLREDGQWVRYYNLAYPACTQEISNDMVFYHVGFILGPDFDSYPVGAKISFRWRAVFQNVGCFTRVTKDQEFQLIKGEPLPSYPGQYQASMHNHSFYTDNIGEFAGSKNSINQFSVVGGRIYLWTDHGYDFTSAECLQMAADATSLTTGQLLVIPGSEGNIDNNSTNETPDVFLHTLTNRCLRTPWEFPGDNTNSRLWTPQQFSDSVASRGGLWAAAHPFASFPEPGSDSPLGMWQGSNISLAMSDPNFVGWQIWNRPRSSTEVQVGSSDYINPYPWIQDPSARHELEFSLTKTDAIQQSYLQPLRRATILAGTDDHWDRGYTVTRNSGGQMITHNSALGKCFTIAEMSSFTTTEFWAAIQAGRLYLSNGPACRFGLDADNNGTLETTFGQTHSNASGVIRVLGQSNNEFGPFTRAILYRITPTTRDSVIVPLTGQSVNITWPVSSLPSGPLAVRARLETLGGYGDDRGLILTGWLYFNTSLVGVDSEASVTFSVSPPAPNPVHRSTSWSITLPRPKLVSVAILDASGRQVVRLFNGLASTNLSLHWDGTDSRGHRLPAGLYFIKTRAGDQRHLRKVVLLH